MNPPGLAGLLAVMLAAGAASPSLAAVPLGGTLGGAARIGAAPPLQRLSLVLALRADSGGLERFARAVSTPGTPQYAHYASIAWLSRRFGASAATRRRVIGYLRRIGASRVSVDATGLFADATLSAALATRLFAAPLGLFRSAREGRFVAPTGAVRLPAALKDAVTAVIGLDTQPLAAPPAPQIRNRPHAGAAAQPSSALPLTGTPSGCGQGLAAGGFTPNQYLSAYHYNDFYGVGLRGHGERVGLIEVDGFKRSDITAYARCFGLHVPRLNGFGVGLRKPLAPGAESTLDIEVLDAAAPNLKAIDVYEIKPTAAGILSALTVPLQNHGSKPQVISASLGICEPAAYLAIGRAGLRSVDGALSMAAASGVSVLASTGDQGSADCTQRDGAPIPLLAVSYPASSWWVTGVGGTNLRLTASNQISAQLVWNDTTARPGAAAGGGSSGLFGRPFYQRGSVGPDSRFIPDVSMLADIFPGYTIFCSVAECTRHGRTSPWITVGGTSAATPLLAGGFALVDEDLHLGKRQPLGFANPLLYKLGASNRLRSAVFSDVLAFGNDVGPFIRPSGRGLGCCTAGPGFDRASGWGSVNLRNFAIAAYFMQPAAMTLSVRHGQAPVRHRRILTTVSCAATCRIAALASVSIGRSAPFEVRSKVYVLPSAGRRAIPLRLSSKQSKNLRTALAKGRRIVATVVAVALSPANQIEGQTPPQRLVIGA